MKLLWCTASTSWSVLTAVSANIHKSLIHEFLWYACAQKMLLVFSIIVDIFEVAGFNYNLQKFQMKMPSYGDWII